MLESISRLPIAESDANQLTPRSRTERESGSIGSRIQFGDQPLSSRADRLTTSSRRADGGSAVSPSQTVEALQTLRSFGPAEGFCRRSDGPFSGDGRDRKGARFGATLGAIGTGVSERAKTI